jgi:hypothetical protein
MKSVAIFAAALVLSLLAGGGVLQLVAESVRPDETFVVAYLVLPLLVMANLAILALTLILMGTHRGVDLAAVGLALFFLAAGIGLSALEWLSAPTMQIGHRGVVLIAAMAAGCLAALAIQWLMIRRLGSRPAAGQG